MRGIKAKKLRKIAYGDRSLRQKRTYTGIGHQAPGLVLGCLVNTGARHIYQTLKKLFPKGEPVMKGARA